MRTRIVLLLVLLTLLTACSSSPNPGSNSGNAVWDQSNFETSNWN
jgi:outer membrane biogenesis lipoprotein LolB